MVLLEDPDLAVNTKDIDSIFKEAFPDGKQKVYFADFKRMMQCLASTQ